MMAARDVLTPEAWEQDDVAPQQQVVYPAMQHNSVQSNTTVKNIIAANDCRTPSDNGKVSSGSAKQNTVIKDQSETMEKDERLVDDQDETLHHQMQ